MAGVKPAFQQSPEQHFLTASEFCDGFDSSGVVSQMSKGSPRLRKPTVAKRLLHSRLGSDQSIQFNHNRCEAFALRFASWQWQVSGRIGGDEVKVTVGEEAPDALFAVLVALGKFGYGGPRQFGNGAQPAAY